MAKEKCKIKIKKLREGNYLVKACNRETIVETKASAKSIARAYKILVKEGFI